MNKQKTESKPAVEPRLLKDVHRQLGRLYSAIKLLDRMHPNQPLFNNADIHMKEIGKIVEKWRAA